MAMSRLKMLISSTAITYFNQYLAYMFARDFFFMFISFNFQQQRLFHSCYFEPNKKKMELFMQKV